jgi:hypothetical protein
VISFSFEAANRLLRADLSGQFCELGLAPGEQSLGSI